MGSIQNNQNRDDNLRKLGIREIQERLEVSPIITDPGSFGVNVEDPGAKTYHCNIFIHKPTGFEI